MPAVILQISSQCTTDTKTPNILLRLGYARWSTIDIFAIDTFISILTMVTGNVLTKAL